MLSLLTFLYTGELTLNQKNIAPVFATATKLEIPDAVHLCKKYMEMLQSADAKAVSYVH